MSLKKIREANAPMRVGGHLAAGAATSDRELIRLETPSEQLAAGS
jgi:hypothetical protein